MSSAACPICGMSLGSQTGIPNCLCHLTNASLKGLKVFEQNADFVAEQISKAEEERVEKLKREHERLAKLAYAEREQQEKFEFLKAAVVAAQAAKYACSEQYDMHPKYVVGDALVLLNAVWEHKGKL
jgi:hypothetical protein